MPAWLITLIPVLIDKMPGLVVDIIGLFSKATPPTDADWQAVITKAQTTYGFEAGH